MFDIGSKVKLKYSNISGIITTKNDSVYHLNINGKNVIVKENMIELSNTTDKLSTKKQKNISYDYTNTFTPEITIRHQTLDIAMYNVENFVNEAILNGVKNIKIIHGRNGGILRKAVHEYLKHNKNVDSFRLGDYYEGSYGVTLIKLK